MGLVSKAIIDKRDTGTSIENIYKRPEESFNVVVVLKCWKKVGVKVKQIINCYKNETGNKIDKTISGTGGIKVDIFLVQRPAC